MKFGETPDTGILEYEHAAIIIAIIAVMVIIAIINKAGDGE